MIPDAPELIEQVLAAETDASCQRNAFVVLAQTEPSRASAYFDSIAHKLETLDPQLQMSIIEFMLGDCAASSNEEAKRAKYTQCLFDLLSSAAISMVKYEACTALMALSVSPAAIKAVASCYVDMAIKEADNNTKLLILDRLHDLQQQHSAVVNEGVLDVLRVLSTADAEIRRRALRILLNGISRRIAEEMIGFFRKELAKLSESSGDRNILEYKRELLRAVHVCASKYADMSGAATACWTEFLGRDGDAQEILEVPAYIKEALEKNPGLCPETVAALAEALKSNTGPALALPLFWIVSEFAASQENLTSIFEAVREGLGDLPLVASEERAALEDEEAAAARANTTNAAAANRVLADGTYASENAFSNKTTAKRLKPVLRQMLLDGHHSVGASISLCLTKTLLRVPLTGEEKNRRRAEVMLVATSIIRLGLSRFPTAPIDQDTYERIMLCIRILTSTNTSTDMEAVLAEECRRAYETCCAKKETVSASTGVKASAPIQFRLASQVCAAEKNLLPADFCQRDLLRAIEDDGAGPASVQSSALSKVIQLTGFSDPIYAETYVQVNQSDLLLDVLVVNQTAETLQNVTFDLACSGDLRVVEKPSPLTLSPHGFAAVKICLKVASTGNGLVYGAISYGTVEPRSVVLAPLPVDIVEYIRPATIDEAEFRQTWTLLEWENKINITPVSIRVASSSELVLRLFLERLLAATHLACITPSFGLAEGGEYLAANMYAKSVFGEDVLANICLERTQSNDGTALVVTGHVRLRSKTQGIAIALGDKISAFIAQK